MPVTVPSTLQRQAIMAGALEALSAQLIPLNAFSTAYSDIQLEGNNKMQVPYFPLESSASVDFNPTNGYVFGDAYAQQTREVTINKRKYQPLSINSVDVGRQPHMDLEKVGRMKGLKLAADVMADILSIITLANYGPAVFTGVATAFDFAALNEAVGVACDDASWPTVGRTAVLRSAYYRNLVTDLGDVSKYGSDDPVKRGVLMNVAGFDELYNNQTIPGNGQNLQGFVCMPSAVLVGFAPIRPDDEGKVVDYDVISGDNGLSIEYRRWFEPGFDQARTTIEVNYGFAIGETAALGRIVSA